MRDQVRTRVAKFAYGLLALGWHGGNRQWRHYEMAYLVLAGISTPLVLSVHSTVSFDFATWVDVCTFTGTIGLFITLFLLFIRFFPMIAMSEVKNVLPEADPHYLPAPEAQPTAVA
jgi:hypothetical protein